MYHEGDIRPVVKRVRPYKTLLLNLPPKSFGFWVLANTQVEACYESSSGKLQNLKKSKQRKDENFIKTKRSVDAINDDVSNKKIELSEESSGSYDDIFNGVALKERVDNINNYLRNVHRTFRLNSENTNLNRAKRDAFENIRNKYSRRHDIRSQNDDEIGSNIFNKLTEISKSHSFRNTLSALKDGKSKWLRKPKRNSRFKSKRNSKQGESDTAQFKNSSTKKGTLNEHHNTSSRKRRSITGTKFNKYEEPSSENKIPEDSRESFKFGTFLHKLKKISELPLEIKEKDEDYGDTESGEGIVLKTKLLEDSAIIDITEKSHSGLLKSTLQDILSLLSDLNKNVNRFWTAITILE